MQESKKSLLIIIIAVALLAGLIFLVQYQKAQNSQIKKGGKSEESKAVETPVPIVAPKDVGAGKTGETKETLKGEETVVLPPEPGGPPQILPPVIFNESGTIKEIKKDSLVIAGTGYNFADQKPRDLTLKFTAVTKTKTKDKTKFWLGFEGLKNLAVGDEINFESPENIRGKTEFEVSYINKL